MTARTINRSMQEPARPIGRAGRLAYGAAGFSLVAALIHLWVMSEHLAVWWGYGAFFLIAALAQGLFSALVLRFPTSKLVSLTGIAGNLIIVFLYVISRTWGMPFGSDWTPFSPSVAHLENPEVLGVTATLAEVGVIFVCVSTLRGAWRRWTVNALLLFGAALWALRFAGILP